MYSLRKAEEIDNFQEKVKNNKINNLARINHYYLSLNTSDIKYNYPYSFFLEKVEIISMHPTAEAGLPHTRPSNIICLPAYYPEDRLDEILKHEYLHIDQRNRRQLWNTKFEHDGWKQINQSLIPERWLNRCRINPDTIDQPFWSFKGNVPLPLFEREDKPNLREVQIHWWDINSGIKQSQEPRSFLEKYGKQVSQPEHPREIFAVELSKNLQRQEDIDNYLTI